MTDTLVNNRAAHNTLRRRSPAIHSEPISSKRPRAVFFPGTPRSRIRIKTVQTPTSDQQDADGPSATLGTASTHQRLFFLSTGLPQRLLAIFAESPSDGALFLPQASSNLCIRASALTEFLRLFPAITSHISAAVVNLLQTRLDASTRFLGALAFLFAL